MARSVKLGGQARGPMPNDGRAYVVIDGKWVPVAHDESDGVPADLRLPDGKQGSKGVDDGAAT